MKVIILINLLLISLVGVTAPEDDFVITVKTDEAFTNPFLFEIATSGSGYNYNVDCNDDGVDEATAQTGNFTCDYLGMGGVGTYTIRIKDNSGSGDGFPRINNALLTGDSKKIMSLDQWGTGRWTSMENAFYGAENMVILATDVPNLDLVVNMFGMFINAESVNPDVGNWDVSLVINMSYMFAGADLANPDVSNWDVSSVTDMSGMFKDTKMADPDVSNWDVSSVTDMSGMFNGAYNANPDVSNWDVSSVTDMNNMFRIAIVANPDVSNWDVSSVTNMRRMFYTAKMADPNVSNWDVSSVTNMNGMFNNAIVADPDVSNWNVSSATNMNSMFAYATSAVPRVDNWDVSSVTDMSYMFSEVSLPPWLYDAILVNFNEQTLKSGVSFDAGDTFYCNGLSSRENVVNTYDWMIEDYGLNCGSDVSIEFLNNNQLIEYDQSYQQSLSVTNTGFQDVTGVSVTTEFSTSHANLTWTCQAVTGLGVCPADNGVGDLSETVDLQVNDQLNYVFSFDLVGSNELSATARIELMGPGYDIYLRNNLSEAIYAISKISKYTSGSWYDPENPGHGVFLEVLEGQENQADRLSMYWFTYHDSKPVWLSGIGEITNGDQVTINLQITSGADFSPNFNAIDVVAEDWGQVTMYFQGPHSVKLNWETLPTHSDFGSGEINFTQFSTISESTEGCYSGSFYNPNQSGHGFYIHVTDASNNLKQVNVSWFTYHEGELFWLVGSGILDQNDTSSIQLKQFNGASFFNLLEPNGWSFNSEGLVDKNWGDLMLSYTNKNNINIFYQPRDTSQFEFGELTMTRLTSMKGHSCDLQTNEIIFH